MRIKISNPKDILKFNCFILLLTGLFACNKADDFYQELKDRPEIMSLNYKALYEVGDTLTLTGRLNPGNNLIIRIGNTDAKIVAQGKVEADVKDTELDQVKVLITEEMGAGTDRPVTIISGGYSTDAPAIEIYSSKAAGYLTDKLKMVSQYSIPAGSVFLTCLNGKGSAYFWKNDGTVQKISKDGSASTALQAIDLKDGTGQFAINTFYGGGIDVAEKYLYFSALTSDASPDNANSRIFRLCKFDLQTKTLVTLNRTLFSKTAPLPLVQAELPMEGNIQTVKLLSISKFYPDSKGNLYIQPSTPNGFRYATALLKADGSLKYIFKTTGNEFETSDLIRQIPGVGIQENQQGTISAEDGLMYNSRISQEGLTIQYDLKSGSQVYTLNASPVGTSGPVIFGGFANITGSSGFGYINLPSRFGFMPLGKAKLVVLYYQGLSGMNNFSQYPALGILDFSKKRGDRYAPSRLETGTFQMQYADQMLNYDEEGMLYMTANDTRILVKTIKQ